MVTSLLFVLAGHASAFRLTPVSGSEVWEETPVVQKLPGYHPLLRFNPSSQYAYGRDTKNDFIFLSPDYICEGKYQVQDDHYTFHPLTCFQCGNWELNKLVEGMDPQRQRKIHEAYARSMQDFEADYNESTGLMHLSHEVEGHMQTFELHTYTEGDDQLSGDGQGVAGLWHAPEPFPDKLDAKTRNKIDLDGLAKFSEEAKASDGAQFGLLDVRVDSTYRNGARVDRWARSGSILKLFIDGKEMDLDISANGQKLLSHGKTVYVRD